MTILIIYETYNNGNETRKTLKEYEDYDSALTTLHSELAKAIPDETVSAISVAIADDALNVSRKETYVRPVTVAETAEA